LAFSTFRITIQQLTAERPVFRPVIARGQSVIKTSFSVVPPAFNQFMLHNAQIGGMTPSFLRH
jgi:hypothetical protein